MIDKPHYALSDRACGTADESSYPAGVAPMEFPQAPSADRGPAVLAARELREGDRAAGRRPDQLGMLDVAAGMSSQRGHVFLATGISEGAAQREHEEQDMRFDWFTGDRIEEMMRSGEITDAQSIAAWTPLRLHTGR